MNEKGCPVCSNSSKYQCSEADIQTISCPRCGEFKISEVVITTTLKYNSLDKIQVANLSGYIRENQKIKILPDDIERLKSLKTPTVAEKAEKLLLYLSREFPVAGQEWVDKDISKDLFLSVAWAQDRKEVEFLMVDYLDENKGFLKHPSNVWKITPEGWAYIDSLKQINPESQIAFIAMWFDEKVKLVFEKAIKTGVEAAGYEPKRIDMHQHNNRIDDEIIAMIRKSKFMVADFTGQRGGVYFEAGFALGMGIPVIWLCRKDELKKVHFDNRQYNFIVWEEGNLDDLAKKLQYRIEATIGKGRYTESP